MKLVAVTWSDANGGHRMGWRPMKDMVGVPTKCVSVGFVVHDDMDCIVICPHSTDDGSGDGEITIPKGCILETRVIE